MRLQQLRELVAAPGPFASVYVDASHDTEDAAHQAELRWQAARSELASLGTGRTTVDAIGRVLLGGEPPIGAAGRAVIAAAGDVLADEPLPVPPARPIVRHADLPYLVPLLASARPPVPHVVVTVNRVGGRCYGVDRDGTTVATDLVQGQDHHIHHVAGGAWAHGRMENRAEETVRQNMREVADHAARLVNQVGADILVVAGDVSARAEFTEALPEMARRLVTEVDIDANAIDAEPTVLDAAVRRLLAEQEAHQDAELLDRLRAGSAHGTACQGLADVTEALRFGQVDTLLVTDPVLADRTVRVGDDRTQVTTARAGGSADGSVERADEAVPVAAIATSADVRVLTGGEAEPFADGVAALLRFSR